MARPDASNVAASSTEHRQADMAAALHRSAELSSAQETDANETACWANEIDDKMSDAEKTQMQRNTYKPLALPTTFAAAPSSEHRQADVLTDHDSNRVVTARVLGTMIVVKDEVVVAARVRFKLSGEEFCVTIRLHEGSERKRSGMVLPVDCRARSAPTGIL